MSRGRLGSNIDTILGVPPPTTGQEDDQPRTRERSGAVTEEPDITRYHKAHRVLEPRLQQAKAVTPVPAPLRAQRTTIDTEETELTRLTTAGEYGTAIAQLAKLGLATNTFLSTKTQWDADKETYEREYAGQASRVSGIPAENTLTRAMKARRKAVMDEEAKRIEAVKPDVQNYATAKDVAVQLKAKLNLYDAAALNETKLKGDLAKVFAVTPINKVRVTEIANMAGGDGALDALMKTLDETSDKAIARTALEVRFGVTINMEAEKDTTQVANNSWKKIYQLMTDVPESHVKNNPSLARINRSETQGTSSYSKGTKQINLRMDRARDPQNDAYLRSRMTNNSGLPPRDAGCEPQNADTVKSFDWTTLHEVGHAVDDSKNYMGTNGEALAGWKTVSIDDVAAAAATHLSFPATYIKAYLQAGEGSTPPVPDKPGNQTVPQWETLRVAACEWCDAIRHNKTLWYNQGQCAARKIGDKVYQEAYEGRFNCYNFAARSKGLRGYSFRAPGEWFADMYAGYHSNPPVMKASHPQFAMIRDLDA